MKRAAIYARVSTNNGQDPEVQLAEIREFCMRREWTTVKEYVDKGISGAKEVGRRWIICLLIAAGARWTVLSSIDTTVLPAACANL